MEKLNDFYEKFPGSYVAYVGFAFSIIFISIAAFLYSLDDPTFSIFTHFLSDLGAASKSSSLVFNIGMIISSPIRVLFGLYLLKFLEIKGADKKSINITAYAVVIGAIGSVVLSIFPYDVFRGGHMIGALTYFISAVIIQINISKIELRLNSPKYLPVIGLIVVANYVLFVGFEISEIISEGFRMLACFFEWMGYFSLMVWLVLHGYHTQKAQ